MNKLVIDDIIADRISEAAECPFRRIDGERPYCQLMPYTNRLRTPLIKCDYQSSTIIINERLRPYHLCHYTPNERTKE